MYSIRRLVLIAALATIAAAGCSSSHADTASRTARSAPMTTAVKTTTKSLTPEQAAVALGKRLLDEARLPDGAHVSTAAPPAHMQGPQVRPAMGNLVFAHRIWTVPGSPDAVQRWLQAHVPDGFVARGTGSVSGPGYRIIGVQDDLASLPANTSTAEMELAIAPDGKNSIVRADTLVGWTAPRPADEFVPAKDRVVTVRVVHTYAPKPGTPPIKTVVVTDPKLVAPIVHAFNALAVSPPDSVHSCPLMTSGGLSYRVEFSAAPSAKPDLTASIGGCDGVAVSIGEQSAPGLGELSSGAFTAAVAHALGVASLHFN